MIAELSQFHFIRPLFLLAIPVLFGLWLLVGRSLRGGQWESYITREMLDALRVSNSTNTGVWRWLLLCAWITLVIAMAGPTWVKTTLPTVSNQQALVLVLDLSPSMLAEDLLPNRLTRAKFKIRDILKKRGDGQVALIAYAGGAHIVSPLSDDPDTIEALLAALSPQMMPSQGSNTEAAISLAVDLLQGVKASSNEILLITDGITADAQENIRLQLLGKHRLSILAAGSSNAAPVPVAGGGFLRSSAGNMILAEVNNAEMAKLANDLGGRHVAIQPDDSDIDWLLDDKFSAATELAETDSVVFDSWADMGHWLVLLVLPFAAFCFRRGLIYALPLLFMLPPDLQAAESSGFGWRDLWQTPDQQAAKLLAEQQYEQAASRFENEDWSAIANYRNGKYEQAASQFDNQLKQAATVRNLYNKANALALEGDLENAIKAYEQVLHEQADHEDAAHNLAIVEQLKAQNQKQSDQQQSQDSEEQSEPQGGQANQPPPQNQDPQNSPNDEASESSSENNQQQSEDAEQQAQNQQQEQSGEQDEQSPSQDQQAQDDAAEQQNREQTAEQLTEDQAEQQGDEPEQTDSEQEHGEQQAEELDGPIRDTPTQLQDSSEQWLRSIEGDPSGLLKRKFEYQARQRAKEGKQRAPTNKSAEPRY